LVPATAAWFGVSEDWLSVEITPPRDCAHKATSTPVADGQAVTKKVRTGAFPGVWAWAAPPAASANVTANPTHARI
jgi:hypothetical protein